MWCMNEQPDQSKIFKIQSSKINQTTEETVLLLGNRNDDDTPKKTYNKTPKPRKQSKIDEADNES
jgi:hypothetical protein